MNPHPLPPLSLLLVLSGLGACRGEATPAAPPADKVEAATALARAFGAKLLGELRGAIDQGGTASAIGVCSERAPAIAAEVATSEFTVRRIGTRVRNKQTNSPSAEGKAVLAAFAARPRGELAQAREVRTRDGGFAVYLPIVVHDPICLRCHGPAEQIEADVRQKLAELYPDDEATGYAIGDLRGAFVVDGKL